MKENDTKNICCSDIGYHGTPIDALTREDKRLGSIADSQEQFS
jgi:hypothetical protein